MAQEKHKGLSGWASWGKGLVGSVSKVVTKAFSESDLEVVNPDEDDGDTTPVKHEEERKHLWQQLSQYVGSDVMSLLSIPTWLMEPFSTLQKMGEITEFMDCLNKANLADDPHVRAAYVAAFACGAYPSIKRTYKPFNPLLGETYELELADGTLYLAEQVSHHPPIAAAHAENENFCYDIVSAPKTKFHGNSIDVFPYGTTRIKLKAHGETYALVPPICRANNLIVGRTWVDAFGDLLVVNITTGEYAALHFTQCGFFGAGRYKVAGSVYSPDNEPKLAIAGKWNEQISYMACDAEGAAKKGAEGTEMWRANGIIKGDHYGFSEYSKLMQTMETAPHKGHGLLPTDSRIRPDIVAMLEGDARASSAKHELEERQRAEKKRRVAENGSWTARWFKPADRHTDADMYEDIKEFEEDVIPWQFTGAYDERKKTISDATPIPNEFAPWQYQ